MENENLEKNGISKYFIWLMVLMGMVHIVDVVVSNVGTLIRTAVAKTYFPTLTLEEAAGRMNIIGSITVLVMLFQPLIKVATDRWGRKSMIIVTALGMSIGNLLQGLAPSFIIYVVGSAFAIYFLSADIQLLLIAEESPEEKRGFWILFTIFIGNLATLVVPFLKGIFISDDYSRNDWQILYLMSAGLGIVLFFVMIFTMRESKAYLEAKEKNELEIKSGKRFSFINAIKDLKKSVVWKTYRWYLLATVAFGIPVITFASFTEITLSSYGYLESEKNIILYIRIGFSVLWFLFTGFLSDKIGRKKVLILDQILYSIGVILFLILIKSHNIVVVGFAWGFMFGGTYGFMNLNVMATNEVVPTKLRASANALGGLIMLFLMAIASIVFGILVPLTGFDVIFYISFPFTILLIATIFLKYEETKGIDLEEIKE